ncbi:uncharacterized protein LOC116615674 [Nematostella vectensis]|uniref:uncharacterized protein LOC116615674 n=1 Tax=Nematostella vectensis TaxID=45351 RepID=UPI0020778D14|nr:uncharacterized protein LOC116615674 [Nematostella vectensis]
MTERIDGITHLCFFDEGSWFQGRLITEQKRQYGLLGQECNVPSGRFHECCFDEEPAFFNITLIDFENKTEKIIRYVMKTNGDNCTLECDALTFHTEDLLVGEKAVQHVEKFCSPKLKGKECIVCAGHMTIELACEESEYE